MKPTPTLLEAAKALISVYDEQSQVAQRIICGGRSDRQLREDGLIALKDLRDAVAALSVPAAAVVGEPVGYVSVPELVNLKMGVSCVDLFREPQPGGIDFAPLYAAPSAPEGWQPIETAPKDGTKMLLCLTGYQPVVGYFDGESERWEYQDSGDFVEEDHWFAWQEQTGDWFPDHWMPLPAPPALRSETP